MTNESKTFLVVITVVLTLFAYHIGQYAVDRMLNNYAHEVEMRLFSEIDRQCNSPLPLLMNGKFYSCKPINKSR